MAQSETGAHGWWKEGGWFAVMRERPGEGQAASRTATIGELESGPWLDAGLIGSISPPDDDLRQLEKPVLIMEGELDLPGFFKAVDEFSALLPNGRRTFIAESRGIAFWEFPCRVNAAVRSFIAIP